jgi:hypothetical protein
LLTFGLLVGAILAALFAFLAYGKQRQEVKLLQDQAGRDIEQRRRAQAAKVFITAGGVPPRLPDQIRVVNSSEQPIYDLLVSSAAYAELQRLPFLMAGDAYAISAGIQDAAGNMPPVWLDFRDAAGQHWRTTSLGELTECELGAAETTPAAPGRLRRAIRELRAPVPRGDRGHRQEDLRACREIRCAVSGMGGHDVVWPLLWT